MSNENIIFKDGDKNCFQGLGQGKWVGRAESHFWTRATWTL